MPFLRFSRDKRGYESTYLVHIQNRRGRPSRQRILYWYRTPPGVRVGRPPFDEEAQRRLEAQNPDVTFDWPAIIATPIPPPAENEQWRERRRAERAAKQAQRADEEAALRNDQEATAESPGAIVSDDPRATGDDTPERLLLLPNLDDTVAREEQPQPASDGVLPTEMALRSSETVASEGTGDRSQDPAGRKRRRRGGRRRRGKRPTGPFASSDQQTPGATVESGNPVEPTAPGDGSSELAPDSETAEFDSNEE